MSLAARISDQCGGTILTGSSDVFINGLGAAFVSSKISPHDSRPVHNATVMTGSSSVFVNGLPLARLGDKGTCVHQVSTSSTDVFGG